MDDQHRLKYSELFRLSLRTFKVKPVRAILTILGMAVGIGVVLFLVSLGYGLQYILIGNLVTTQDSLVTMEASYPSETGLLIKPEEINTLQTIPNVVEVSAIAEFPGQLVTQETSASPALISVRIIDPVYFRLTGLTIDVGTAPLDTSGIVLYNQTLGVIGYSAATTTTSLGKEVTLQLLYQNGFTGLSEVANSVSGLPITGVISDDSQPPMALVYPDMLTKPPPFYSSVLVKASGVETLEEVRNKLISLGFIVSAKVDLVNQARQITNVITGVLGVFGVAALIVSAIGMFNTMIVGFLERIYEVGILKSIGATDADVKKLFLMESAIMGFLGGAFGILFGWGAAQAVNLALNVVATKLGGKEFTLFITPLWFVGLIMLLSIGIGLFAGFWPARRASQLSPKEAFINR